MKIVRERPWAIQFDFVAKLHIFATDDQVWFKDSDKTGVSLTTGEMRTFSPIDEVASYPEAELHLGERYGPPEED